MGHRRTFVVLVVLLVLGHAVTAQHERRLQAGSLIDDSGSVEFPSDSGSGSETTPVPTTKTPKPSTTAPQTTTASPSTTTAAPSSTTKTPSSTTATPTTTTVQPNVGSSSSSSSSSADGSGTSSGSSSSSPASSQSSAGSASSTGGGSSSSSNSGLSSGIMIGIIAGGLVLVVVVFGFLAIRCCRRKRQDLENGITIDSPVSRGQSRHYKATSPSSWGVPYQEITATTGTKSTGTMGSVSNRASLWEEPELVAARIPLDSIKVGELLGQGGFGEVCRGEYRNQPVAIKRLLPATRKNMQHIENFLAEIKLMSAMEHPHIVQFVGVAWDSLSDLMCLTDFMAGGDLRTMLIRCNESQHPLGYDPTKTNIALHVAHGLTYLHSLNPIVLHRDLKSRNVLLTNKLEAKLTDFGVSRERSDRTMTANVGSCLWMAPEVMMGKRYDEKADIFSLGIVMAELDTQELPYSHVREPETGHSLPDMVVLQLVTSGSLRVQLSDRLQPNLRHLITECVNLDPRARPTAAQVLYELQMIGKSMH